MKEGFSRFDVAFKNKDNNCGVAKLCKGLEMTPNMKTELQLFLTGGPEDKSAN